MGVDALDVTLLVGCCLPADDPELEVRLVLLEPLLEVFLTCIALPVGTSGDVLDICRDVSFESLPVSSMISLMFGMTQKELNKQNADQHECFAVRVGFSLKSIT